MEYRQLGQSGLRISTLSFGTATFGGVGPLEIWGDTDVSGAQRLLDICLDAGVNLVDTADAYGWGKSEEILGEALKGRRDRLLVSTKALMPMGEGPNDAGLSRHHLINSCEESLQRLQIDHIDLYMLHGWDGQTAVEETIEALHSLVLSGKVRYVGCSNFTGWQLMKTNRAAVERGLQTLAAQQIYLSLHARDAEFDVIPAAIDQGLGTLVWSPLAGGLLSGKYRRGVRPEGTSRHLSTEWNEPPIYDEDALYDTIDVLVRVADNQRVPPAQVALAWLLQRPGITSLVIGARDEKQLTANLGAVDLQLTGAELDELERVSRLPLPYPHWHQVKCSADRLGAADLSVLAPYLSA